MREIIQIAINDLRNTFSERGVLISLLVVPMIMTVFLAISTGGIGSTTLTIDIINQDAIVNAPNSTNAGNANTTTTYSAQFIDLLKAEGGSQFTICVLNATDSKERCDVSVPSEMSLSDYADQRIKDGTAFATVILPATFSADLGTGKSSPIGFVTKGGLNAPQLIRQKVDTVITRMNGAIAAARVVTNKQNPPADQRQAVYNQSYAAASAIWASDPIRIVEQLSGPANKSTAGTGFGQSAPGMGSMFVLLNALGLSQVFLAERKSGVLQRLIILPLPRWKILAGKLLGRYVLGLIVFAVLIGLGTIFGTQWGDLLGVVLTVLVYTLAVTAISLAFSALVRSQGQANGLALVFTLTLAPLGGAWWPLSIVPDWMRVLGHISPIAWSQEAFNKLIFYGGHVQDILPQLGVLLIFAAVFFVVGVTRFSYE